MSLFKYFQERGNNDQHPGVLGWLRGEPMPPLLNNNRPALTQTELESLEVQYHFRRKKFCLWVPGELAEYCDICDKAANGWYIIRYQGRHEAPDHGDEYVYLEWLQQYTAVPPPRVPSEEEPAVWDVQTGGG